jgi:hypothetical protein
MRDNSSRFQPNLEGEDAAATPVAQQQPDLFSFSTPTEFVTLPSRGKYYSEDHPLYEQESVEIRYMTAKDEDILSSTSLIKKGLVLDRFIENVLTDRRIKARDLLVGDKNAILIASRITGFGSEYATKVTCPNCSTINSFSFELSEIMEKEQADLEELGVQITERNTFLVELPATGIVAEVKLLTGHDESAFIEITKRQGKRGIPEAPLTTHLKSIVVSLAGVEDRSQISIFIDGMPATDSRYLRGIYAKIIPNVDMRQDFQCEACGADPEVNVPISADFFWNRP